MNKQIPCKFKIMESLRDVPKSSSISQPNKERTASGLAQDDDIFDGKFHIKIFYLSVFIR